MMIYHINHLKKNNPKSKLILNIKIFFLIISLYLISNKYIINKKNNKFNNYMNITDYYNLNFFQINAKNLDNYFFLINDNKTQIENIFILIGIIPFLKKKIKITKKNIKIYAFFRNILGIKKSIIFISKSHLHFIIKKFKYILFYKWQIIPKKQLIDTLRYIINNYYNEACLKIFDQALNLNLNYYIKNHKNKLSLKEINELMSKLYYLFNIFRKYWNLC